MKQIEQLLRQTMGLSGAALGPTGIQRAVRHRMRSLGLKRVEDYRQLLPAPRGEWSELVELVVVPESWFFRESEAIAAFTRAVTGAWLPAHPHASLRVLSLPCAAGEEPYSLAIALLEAGVPPSRFQIEAGDISTRALAAAQRGVYRGNAFRGKDLWYRDRYFQQAKDGFVLAPAVRQCVRFFQANLLSDTFLPGHGVYDFVFCRNLLIYFDAPTQRNVLARLERLLAPGGILFVGPVERPMALDFGLVSANLCSAFTVRQPGRAPRRPKPPRPLNRQVPAPQLPGNGGPKPGPLPGADLDAALRHIQAGRLKEAAEICESRLLRDPACAQAYYLLGRVREAGGDPRALDCLRKAIYLEPNHCDSLEWMAYLLEQNGDSGRARAYKIRAQRIRLKT
ncbi:MAG TPA: CheR family methyltransferase [Candidatus Paceibacterota bacterium]|nr:CheR family methyltransferase [Verrucomicrobiota bacterium]HSA11168.1 CheR family methyltransferase [Candidatus Paceibacterota bacterium]